MSVDLSTHIPIIKLLIAYTILGAFIFTVLATCLSLVGLVKFARPSQQSKLFTILIVELVTICIGVFANLLEFDPKETKREVERPLVEATETAKNQATSARAKLQDEVLAGLKPEASGLALLLLKTAKERGIELRLTSGYRSPEQQAELVASGRSAARLSTHNTGLAFDVVVIGNGQATFDQKKYERVGEIGKSIGLIWGGDWKPFSDPPHFETSNAKAALAMLRGGA